MSCPSGGCWHRNKVSYPLVLRNGSLTPVSEMVIVSNTDCCSEVVTGVFCQSAIQSAQNDDAHVLQAMMDEKDLRKALAFTVPNRILNVEPLLLCQ